MPRMSNGRRSLLSKEEKVKVIEKCVRLKKDYPHFTVADLSRRFGLHPNLIPKWAREYEAETGIVTGLFKDSVL